MFRTWKLNNWKLFGNCKVWKLEIAFFALLLLFVFVAKNVDAAVLQKPPANLGLVGYWPMNEGTSTFAGDFSGNGNKGTLTSMALNPSTPSSGWNPGKLGKALSFDGSDDYVQVPHSPSLIPVNLTVSVWVYYKGPLATYSNIILKGTGPYAYQMYINTDNDLEYFSSGGAGDSVTDVPQNQWSHLVITVNGSNGTFYINGKNVGTDSTMATGSGATGVMRIGMWSINLNPFNGLIDEVRIYNRALSAGEVAGLYKSGAAKINAPQNNFLANGLVGMWSFNGPDMSGDTAYDRSGQGNNGTLTSGPSRAIGKVGQALSFDGSNDYVTMGTPSILNFGSPDDFSLAAWYRFNVTTFAAGDDQAIISQQNTGGSLSGYRLSIEADAANDPWSFDMRDSSSFTMAVEFPRPNDTGWHHIAVTTNASSTAAGVKAYIDGVPQTLTVITDAITASIKSTASFRVGEYFSDSVDGLIDEVRIYNRALSAGEVKQLYDMGR